MATQFAVTPKCNIFSQVSRAKIWSRCRAFGLGALGTLLVGIPLTSVSQLRPDISIAPQDVPKLQEDFEELRTAVNAALDILPGHSYDTHDFFFEYVLEPQDTISWMQENVSWVPYIGSLRGPTGVLMDRRGNSLDQSLLLAMLLENAGYDVRLAHGQIAEGAVEQLLDRLLSNPLPDLQRQLESERKPSAEAEALRRVGLSPAEAQELAASSRATAAPQVDALLRLVAKQAEQPAESAAPSILPQPVRDAALAALTDHWWVQYRDGGAGWIDADPVFGDHEQMATEWIPAPPEIVSFGELPQELKHNITIRVIAEQWQDDSLAEQTALEVSFVAADLVQTPLTVVFAPVGFMAGGPDDLSGDDALRHVAVEEIEWLPVIEYGDTVASDSSVRTDGSVNENPNLTTVTQAFSAAQNVLSSLVTASSPRAEGSSELSAIWLEYQIDTPGTESKIIRRQIFDLLGEDVRAMDAPPSPNLDQKQELERGLALLGSTQILPLVSWLQPGYVQDLLLRDVQSNIDAATAMSRAIGEELVDPVNATVRQSQTLNPLPAELYTWHLYRSELSRDAANLFIASPNLVSTHLFPAEIHDDIAFVSTIDIVANDVEVVPSMEADPWRTRLAQGVLDTALEVAVSAIGTGSLLNGFEDIENASALLYQSPGLDLEWAAIADANNPEMLEGGHSSDTVARMTKALHQGQIVVMPYNAIETEYGVVTSWWQIDRRTGQTLGIGPRGWGQGPAIETLTLKGIVQAIRVTAKTASLKTYRETVFCAFASAITILTFVVTVSSEPSAAAVAMVTYLATGQSFHTAAVKVFNACIEWRLFGKFKKPMKKLPGGHPPQLPSGQPRLPGPS